MELTSITRSIVTLILKSGASQHLSKRRLGRNRFSACSSDDLGILVKMAKRHCISSISRQIAIRQSLCCLILHSSYLFPTITVSWYVHPKIGCKRGFWCVTPDLFGKSEKISTTWAQPKIPAIFCRSRG